MYNLLEYLEQTAGRFPDKTAFEDVNGAVTYGQLMQRAKAAGTAIAAVTPPGKAVAVCMEKSVDAVTAFMAALYAGCFYCFVDPKQPAARNKAMLEPVQPAVAVFNDSGKKAAASLEMNTLDICRLIETEPDEAVLSAIRRRHIDLDPAYCSFTSGSTGTPKGVLVSHRSVIDFIDVFVPLFGISDADVLACQSPFDFDVSVKDIYSCLKTGASCFLIPKYYFVFLPNLLEMMTEKKVTTLIWAVSALCMLSERDALEFQTPPCINKILFSGEVMPPSHLLTWKRYYPQAKFVNLYGPTEITCNCTYHILPEDYSGGEIPMGIPFPNERVFLLGDDGSEITAPGEAGEICVAGTAVALGYCGLPDRTEEAFVNDPLTTLWNSRIYKTGDMARYGDDGLMYYSGRRDHQIKRHGRRVELAEIDRALHSIDGVQRACTVYIKESQTLVAFLSGDEPERKVFAKTLAKLLPDYMLPDENIWQESLPLNSHGKIDRTALTKSYLEGKENG